MCMYMFETNSEGNVLVIFKDKNKMLLDNKMNDGTVAIVI